MGNKEEYFIVGIIMGTVLLTLKYDSGSVAH
jgi:hypothetical protein